MRSLDKLGTKVSSFVVLGGNNGNSI